MKHITRVFFSLFLLVVILASPLKASEKPLLRWGGDTEGGVPYMFYDPFNMDRLIGYEVEIMDAIADYLGMKAEFVQNGWDNLIPGLERHLYDVTIDGLEITPEHKEVVNFSIPYYSTFLQLAVRKGTKNIETLEDCKGKVVGTLKQSYAYFTLVEAGIQDIRTYEDEINAFNDLENGRLDATLFDDPIAVYYAGFNPEIVFVGPPVGRMDYGIAVRKEDKELLSKINEAIVYLRDSGKLREIYDRWNLWSPMMAEMFQDFSPRNVEASMFNYWAEHQKPEITWEKRINRYTSFLPILGKAALVTIKVSIAAMVLAILLGLILAMTKIFGPTFFSRIAIAYIEAIRGTPVLIQLFFIFYGLPNIGIKLSPFVAGVLGLGLNYAAYEAENYRAGLLSVPRQQMEGALALGMTRWQALKHVVLPQAVRVALPPVTNDFISLLKDSSLVSVITMVDLTKAYGQLATTYYDYFGTGIIVAVIYFLLGLPFVRLARWTEKKMAVAVKGGKTQKNSNSFVGKKPGSY
ncbi:MAG: ABC transporter substrate-binding protein/permease [Aminobacterium sp.]|jgi:polar amino acid transport system substrate-binding protein|uniref:ABC transporter substrate-binding protein/permease n=1 Tax=Aminobacterium sp. TaxID=1872491 RepID=UPI001BD18222|nr:ABC transporter permease subunit [Aminobacterium sp.]MEA4877571.1 ABC transporter substrate-binding protein/permease [Aminobacterium sp.]